MLSVDEHDGIVQLTLCKAPFNTLDRELAGALEAVLAGLGQRDDVSLLYVRSGVKAFCGGVDVAVLERWAGEGQGGLSVADDVAAFERVCVRIETAPFLTVAELSGSAVGAGLGLALSFDLRLAATEAKLGIPEAAVGTLPTAGTLRRLLAIAGRGTAYRLLATGALIDGAEALRLGLVDWACPRAEVAKEGQALLATVGASDCRALRAGKAMIAGRLSESDAVLGLLGHEGSRTRLADFIANRRTAR